MTSQKVKSSIVSKHLKRHRTFKAFSTMEIREVKRWDSTLSRSWAHAANDGRNTSLEVFATFSDGSNNVSSNNS